ncbi:MAG: FAD-dependent oxidoreductase [Mesotoga sp.]|jgi:NADPH-dependent 2,4-dienoyl-CoA reductase/sulfur reductase-like enzyme|uniref:NAD(P)/FAD-dependent oxidoreductase n=1 Tax=unclassified Mesotoga TaxID=1184398 RepID=UPI000EF27C99|nr:MULTISPECIES: FAD-dependent oxidoreductase [unclassified Mesotoga]MDI9368288.1 FAD-dependent oxidoreductase [Thermotogota bacterium]NLT46542.1 FAD-dependent oxidoreductase [Thermotogaceae bacterium]MDD2333447.1 FAD-dependent oxidoreductase [Mesotoga sp.]MDD3680240.1 FAD-dependent oxidoreductase [Mesotoga sp.]MDD4206478.1 FAD-dependent oxidoreductase [Mesotoga sp.]
MKRLITDVLVIGGGAAGMACALSAAKTGVEVTLLEREPVVGGVLNQCIHNGFGLQFYQEELTGPEFAVRLQNEMNQEKVTVIGESYVREIDVIKKRAMVLSPLGAFEISSKAVVISTGARERPFGSLLIQGDRPSGIMPAGLAQRYVNLENYLPSRKAVVLGSGDIGLIMARRLTLEGVEVVGVVERMPYPGGLTRNIVQCLEDYEIPLLLSTTVTKVMGNGRLEEIEISDVDESFMPIPGTSRRLKADTLILSAGLLPQVEDFDNDLIVDPINKGFLVSNTGESSIEGVFAAGNDVAIFDLVDYVAAEGWIAGRHAALFALGESTSGDRVPVLRGENVGVLVPGIVDMEEHLRLYIRLRKPMNEGTVVLKELDFEKAFSYGVPSEMIQIVINKEKLAPLFSAGRLTVEVR